MFTRYPTRRPPLALLRVTSDWIIDTDDDDHVVSETIQESAPIILERAGFPHGEIVKIEVLALSAVSDEEADERGWTE